MSIVYGPVPSRRLGVSLGVDIVSYKKCTLDCIYCQLGRTTSLTLKRREYVKKETVIREIRNALKKCGQLDYITFAGSGEPTLNSKIGEIIKVIKKETSVPVAVITNGTLLGRKSVRRALLAADLVVPSLDSVRGTAFRRVNRPYAGMKPVEIAEGIIKFRQEYKGDLWLEIMLVKGYNDTVADIKGLKSFIRKLKPGKVHLNTVVRPPAEKYAGIIGNARLKAIAGKLGEEAEIVYDVNWKKKGGFIDDLSKAVMATIERRPVTMNDLAATLGAGTGELRTSILVLEKLGRISREKKNNKTYFIRIKGKG